jgi:hypothetical protein
VPFASDPQSGWLYLPAMAMFMVLPAVKAMEWFIVLQPILAGLGLYWFFRNEGVGRPAATVGGLALALSISGSGVVLSMPFAGTLAWTALTLAGASGFVRARSGLALVAWLAFTAFCWTQIAAAHLTDGLLVGSAILGVYVVARLLAQVRSGERSWRAAGGLVLLLAVPLLPLSAAAWLPRLELIPRTSIGMGYRTLGHLSNQLTHQHALPPLAVHGQGPWWATAFARGLGGYIGAATVLMVPVAFASKRSRLPAIAFGLVALAGWLLNLDRLIAAKPVRALALRLGIGELWLRDPSRFRYAVLLALTVLAGYGVQAWLDMGSVGAGLALRRRLWWLAPGFVLFVLLPVVAGSRVAHYVPFLAGAAVAVPLLALAARGRAWAAPALAGALAVELLVCGIVGQFGPAPGVSAQGLTLVYDPGLDAAFAKLHSPNVDPDAYLTPGPIGQALIAGRSMYGRYLSFDERVAKGSSRGFLSHQAPNLWPAYENARSILFDLDEIQGYSPVQLQRYWRLVRASNTVPIFYNSSTFQSVDPAVMRLFGVRWVIVPTAQGEPPAVPGFGPGTHTLGTPRRVTSEGLFTLYEYPYAEPRTTVAYHVQRISPGLGLATVLEPSFEPADQALVEGLPSGVRLGPDPADQVAVGRAAYQEVSPEHVRVTVATTATGLLVIRNAYDSNWHATVDGRPSPVLLTDYLMQGVVVPTGNHVVELTYEDPWIGRGLLVSGVAWALLLGVLAWLWLVRTRRRPLEIPIGRD